SRGPRDTPRTRPCRSRRAGVARAPRSTRGARDAARGTASPGGPGLFRGTHAFGDRPAHRSAAGHGEDAPAHRPCEAGGGTEAHQGMAAMTDWLGMTPRPEVPRPELRAAVLARSRGGRRPPRCAVSRLAAAAALLVVGRACCAGV